MKRKKGYKTKLKEKLWELCKQIIRRKYGNTCYTCFKGPLEASNWHTGHFIPSSACSTELRYDLRNLRPQCYHCNINLSGNWLSFEKRLIQEEGEDYVDDLKQRNFETKGKLYNDAWFEQMVALYATILSSSLPFGE